MTDRCCTKCKEIKPLTEFDRGGYRDGKLRMKYTCKVCMKSVRKTYNKKIPYTWISKRYNVSLEVAKELYLRSMQTCDICGTSWNGTKERLCVDHCHTTGKVRGILCKHCNHILGQSRDSIQTLQSEIVYLERG